jgi:Transposase DDE domain
VFDVIAMILDAVLDKFIRQSPVTVMMRAVMENVFAPAAIDEIFDRVTERQYVRELLFSSVVDLVGLVVGKVHPSIHAAYQRVKTTLPVSLTSVYNKINATEPAVIAELVRHTAERMGSVIDEMGAPLPALIPGYRVRILDGNHLAATERRLEPLRGSKAGPLPGFAIVVLEPARMLATEMIPCEDGHAQERSLSNDILALAAEKDLWVGDRNFCTTKLLTGLADKGAFFAIRRHAAMTLAPTGTQRSGGRTETGEVYEQRVTLLDLEGKPLQLRLITVRLDKATRDGDSEIAILTNLPAKAASAMAIADLYRKRWTLESMFLTMTQILEGEIKTLGYPGAALLGFGVALVTYNIYSTVQAALRAEFGTEKVQNDVSGYYIADEVQGTMRGMDVAVEPILWETFQTLTPKELAKELRRYARHVSLELFKKHPRGPKKPATPRIRYADQPHVSTARLLAEAKGMR